MNPFGNTKIQKITDFSFKALNSFIALLGTVIFFITIFDRTVEKNSYGLMYDIFTGVISALSLVVSLIFGAFGFMTVKNLVGVGNWKQILFFLSVFLLLFGANMSRFFMLFYKHFFGKYCDLVIFRVFGYIVPDFLSGGVVSFM